MSLKKPLASVFGIRKSSAAVTMGPLFSRRQMGPFALRMAGVAAALLTNLIVAKELTLDQIAYYYVYATLAYVGNAGLYVGLDVVLQRLCASLASSQTMQKPYFLRYIAVSLLAGTIMVTLLSAAYLFARGGETNPWYIALICAALSGATYLSAVGRDLLALSRRLTLAAMFALIEQLLRLSFVGLAIVYIRSGAIEVTAASALATIVSGVTAIAVLLLCTGSSKSLVRATASDIAHTVAPIGFSGLMNWLQLQSYRPALLYFGIQPDVIGIASLLTTLGMAGANPIFTVTAQSYIPRFYAGELRTFRECTVAIIRLALLLALAAIPVAMVFLVLSGRQALLIYVLLVSLGVFVEAGNNVIGAFMHRRNATGGSMWVLAASGSVGVLIVVASWSIPASHAMFPYLIGLGMCVSQIAVIGTIYALSIKKWKIQP